MLKLLLRLLFLTILGVLAFDIFHTGSFQKSQTYTFLKESGAVEYGQIVFMEAKKGCNKGYIWAEKNVPIYYNQTCTHLQPYIKLSYDLSLIMRSSAVSVMQKTLRYTEKNFPEFQNYVTVILTDAAGVAKESLGVITEQLHNYTISAVEYANNMLKS